MSEIYFTFSKNLQDNILFLFLTDLSFMKLCRSKIKSEYFTSEIQQIVAETSFSFFDEFQNVPNEHIMDIMVDVVKEKEVDLYLNYIETLFKLNPIKQFVIKELDKFIQHRNWEITLIKCVDYLKQEDFDSIEKDVISNIRTRMSYVDMKNVLDEDLASFYNSKDENEEFIPTGIKALDKIIDGLKKKELSVFVAPLNVGKTWAMIHLGSKAIVYGKNVLHVTLEMSRHKIKSRYFMHFSGVVNKEKEEIEVWDGNEKTTIVPENLLNSKRLKKSISVMKKYGGKLFIVEYPNDVLTINTLESLLNFMETSQEQIDMLIVDGADGMRYDKNLKSDWEKNTKIYENLRRIAVERNLAVVTVSHSNRDSLNLKLITAKNTKGALEKLNIADLGISINQTTEEYLNQQARLFIMRNRSEAKWKQILINQNYNLGHFCVHSQILDD